MTDKEFITKESLQNLINKELQELYFKYFNIYAPTGLTKTFLIKDILWRLEFGKNSDILQKRIDKLVKDYSKSKAVNISKVKQFEATLGTKFILEFKGEKHEVIVIDNGFKYKDKIYKSLSSIANQIRPLAVYIKWYCCNNKLGYKICYDAPLKYTGENDMKPILLDALNQLCKHHPCEIDCNIDLENPKIFLP